MNDERLMFPAFYKNYLSYINLFFFGFLSNEAICLISLYSIYIPTRMSPLEFVENEIVSLSPDV